jgi:hypothetical protein
MDNYFMRLAVAILVLVLSLIIYLSICPLVFDLTEDSKFSADQTIKRNDGDILEGLDFTKGDWCAYVIISNNDDMDLSKELPRGKILVTRDQSTLCVIKDSISYRSTGGDETTVENELIICRDSKVVFRSKIVLDEFNLGFQSQEFGFVKPDNPQRFIDSFSKFERVYFPFLILRN